MMTYSGSRSRCLQQTNSLKSTVFIFSTAPPYSLLLYLLLLRCMPQIFVRGEDVKPTKRFFPQLSRSKRSNEATYTTNSIRAQTRFPPGHIASNHYGTTRNHSPSKSAHACRLCVPPKGHPVQNASLPPPNPRSRQDPLRCRIPQKDPRHPHPQVYILSNPLARERHPLDTSRRY